MKHSLIVGPALLFVGILSAFGTPLTSSDGGTSSAAPQSSGTSSSPASTSSGTSSETSEGTSSHSASASTSASSSSATSSSTAGTSSSASSTLPAIDYIKVFCETSWSYIYTWTGTTPNVEPQGAWPGMALNSYDADWKTYNIEGYSSINLIFNTGKGGSQTKDLQITAVGYWWYYNSQFYNSNPKGGSSSSSTPSSSTSGRSEEHTSELQSPDHLVCRLLLEKKKKI